MTDAWNGSCPKCNNTMAYEGFHSWECPDSNCENFSAKQKKLVDDELEAQEAAEREYDQLQNPVKEEDKDEADPRDPNEVDFDDRDTLPPGPPDDDDETDYAWGTIFGIPSTQKPKPKAPAPQKSTPTKLQENLEDGDSYPFPYDIPQDLSFD